MRESLYEDEAMRLVFRAILGVVLLMCLSLGWGENGPSTWITKTNDQTNIQVYLFLSSTCPHCQKADAFFKGLEATTPWLEVHRHFINTDKNALETFNQFLKQQNSDDFSVPSMFFCNSRWVGFSTTENSGKDLLRGLIYCHDNVTKTGELDASTVKVIKEWANANWYSNTIISPPAAAAFVPMMAITDALNPCSIFCMVSLFAFLWLAEKRSLQLTLAAVFIIVVGIVHYVQQVYSAFFFQTFNLLRIPLIVIGLGLLAYTLGYMRALNEKTELGFLTLVAFTALGVQVYMQTCTPNFALVFEQWVITQGFSASKISFFQLIYQFFYIIPLLILSLITIFWRKSASFTNHQTIVRKTAHIFLGLVAILFIVYPPIFAKFFLSLLILFIAIIAAIVLKRRSLPLL